MNGNIKVWDGHSKHSKADDADIAQIRPNHTLFFCESGLWNKEDNEDEVTSRNSGPSLLDSVPMPPFPAEAIDKKFVSGYL